MTLYTNTYSNTNTNTTLQNKLKPDSLVRSLAQTLPFLPLYCSHKMWIFIQIQIQIQIQTDKINWSVALPVRPFARILPLYNANSFFFLQQNMNQIQIDWSQVTCANGKGCHPFPNFFSFSIKIWILYCTPN